MVYKKHFLKLIGPSCNNGFMLKICTFTSTSLTLGLVLTASENTAIRVVAKHQRTLSETYVLLTPLSDVLHLSSITVMTDPSVGQSQAMCGNTPQ